LSLLVILCGATSIGFLIVAARRRDVSRELRDLAFFTGGAYIFIFAVGIAFEIGEQARFRMSIDQLSATTALVFIAAAARSAKQRRSVRAKVRATTPPSLARIDHARP
jgi:heme A synthase